MNKHEKIAQLSDVDQAAWQRLQNALADKKKSMVAFSGGVDSALLAAVLFAAVGDEMLAVMVDSIVHTEADRLAAKNVAELAGFPFLMIPFDDLQSESYCNNTVERCYICKFNRFEFLVSYAKEKGYLSIMEGSNADDSTDYRPGMRAVKELGILSPLAENGISKQQIRRFAHALELPVWNRPSTPCLATRIAYGTSIDAQALEMIRQAEAYLEQSGLTVVRVRYDGRTARIEVDPAQLQSVLQQRKEILERVKQIGFIHVSLDLEGYRQGSNNEGYVK